MVEPDALNSSDQQPVSDRRTFLRKAGSTIGAGVAAYAIGLPAAFSASMRQDAKKHTAAPAPSTNVVLLHTRRANPLETLNLGAFSRQINTRFSFHSSDGIVDTVLMDATDLLTSRPGHEAIRECFSLLFRGSINRPMAQGTYPVNHARLGSFELFIVPVREEGDNRYYEAVFNRLREESDPLGRSGRGATP